MYGVYVLCSCGLYLLVIGENKGKMLPKCELGLVCLAHFVLCPGRVHTLTNKG